MTPEFVPEEFEQTMGCTVADLLRALPAALPGADIETDSASNEVRGVFPDGMLRLVWQPLAARRIALLEIPRLLFPRGDGGATDLSLLVGDGTGGREAV